MSKNLLKLNASAGSGKTYALTNTFVDRLFESDIAPCESCRPVKNRQKYNFSELLAITFTNLAANQMKEKVIEKLKQYALKKIPCRTEEKEEKAKQADAMLENIFQQYGALNIRTIDSLLNQIIGLFALELGYAPHFEASFSSKENVQKLYAGLAEASIAGENSQETEAVNYAPVFHELCRNVFQNPNYAGFFVKPALREQVVKFIDYCIKNNHVLSAEELNALEQNYAFFTQKNEEVKTALAATLKKLNAVIAEQKIAVSQNFKNALGKAEKGDFKSTTLSKEKFSELVLKSNTADYTDASPLYEALKKHISDVKLFQVLVKDYALCVPMMKIVSCLYQELDIYEKNQQVINTQKMPHIIAGLLGENTENLGNAFLLQKKQEENLIPAAYCRLGTRLKHILYDEFQDTSLAQWEALKDLSSEALANGGSVFFVGDVKQAIYGWRGGNASLFNDAPAELAFLAEGGVSSDTLKYNWRSAENIINWNNTFFENLSHEEKLGEIDLLFHAFADKNSSEKAFAALKKALVTNYTDVSQEIDENHLPEVAGKGLVEVHTFQESNNFFDVAALTVLPEMVQNLVKKYNDKYGSIAILTVNNSQAAAVAQILLEHGIPVVSQGSLGLKEHPVIVEIIAFLRFLANPLDDNAFCQVLLSRHILPQSFYQNCPPEKIFKFLAKPRKSACFTAFRDEFPDLWQQYFHVFVDGANLLTAYDTLCELYNRMGIMEQNADSSVYLLRLKELAYLAEERGIVDINAFLTWWDANGEKEKAPLPEGLDSVSVLTMHKSKGLEYDAVIIPWHNFKIDVQGDICKVPVPYEGNYTVYAELKKEYSSDYGKAIAEKIAECINLLYVAWTRAKQELHIFIPHKYDANKNGHFYKVIEAFLTETEGKLKKQIIEEKGSYYFGTGYVPVVSEKSLRSLEYVLGCASSGEGKTAYFSEEQEEKITSLFAEYYVEKKAKKSKTEEEENTGSELKIPPDAVLYVARRLSRIFYPFKNNTEEKKSGKMPAAAQETTFNQEHGMDWLPQLRIFRSDLDELRGLKKLSSNKRGTLIHKSLEYLVFSGNLAEDCKRAAYEAMKFLPYGRFLGQTAQENVNARQYEALNAEIQEDLTWFASLQEPCGGAGLWFQYGYKEHCITDEKGNLFRVDLLVEIPADRRKEFHGISYLAIDYKTGYLNEELPNASNKLQIMNYINLLSKSTGKKVSGLLIYLDKRECCLVEGE